VTTPSANTTEPSYATLKDILLDEERLIDRARPKELRDRNLAGLAFSGGGIRSATFNLGLMQGLAELGLLKRFDYLSTVSGGGYIGAFLSALVLRARGTDASVTAHEKLAAAEVTLRDSVHDGVGAVQFLRRYSNYLTPRASALSVDTWTAISTFLRNMALNLAILCMLTVGVVFAVHGLFFIAGRLMQWSPQSLVCVAGGLLALTATTMGLRMDEHRIKSDQNNAMIVVLLAIIPTALAALFISSEVQAMAQQPVPKVFSARWFVQWIVPFAALNTALWLLSAIVRRVHSKLRSRYLSPTQRTGVDVVAYTFHDLAWITVAAAFGGALIGFLLGIYAYIIADGNLHVIYGDALRDWLLWQVGLGRPPLREVTDYVPVVQGAFHATAGLIISMAIFALGVSLQIGICKSSLSESDREWLGRFGGMMYLCCLLIALVGIVVAVGPGFLLWLDSSSWLKWFASSALLAWIIQTVAALLLGRSAASGGREPDKKWLERLLAIAPYVFILGLLVLVAKATSVIATPLTGDGQRIGDAIDAYCQTAPRAAIYSVTSTTLTVPTTPKVPATAETGAETNTAPSSTLDIALTPAQPTDSPCARFNRALTLPLVKMAPLEWLHIVAALLAFANAFALSWRFDINLFSFQRFYRNRLVRCYLGASRENVNQEGRRANAYTNLAAEDDVGMAELAAQRPLHIVNTALNLTAKADLAWQERKSANFAITSLHAGFWLGRRDTDLRGGYRPTSAFACGKPEEQPRGEPPRRGITLGDAMATSGAAASPAMGHNSTPAMAMLLTVFNVRLGRWVGNPVHKDAWQRSSPRIALASLLSELFGNVTTRSSHVYLSDGGHFENTAAYELIRREVPLIVLSDCGADPRYEFSDIANLMRLVQADFGVPIDIDLSKLAPGENGVSVRQHVVGSIRYSAANPLARDGTLIVFKPTLLSTSALDLHHYKIVDKTFPQQTTADQWYSETQFESYRKLGYESVMNALYGGSKTRAKFDSVLL
jgi:Patatin-like phospholipase